MNQLNHKLPTTLLALAGILLIGLGLFHLGVWLVVGGSLEGPVSWRKPILFGFSTGMTVLSLAWIYPKLRPRPWDTEICGLFSVAMLLEVVLITMQQWRGEASHFNHSTPFDTGVEQWMTYVITFATAVILDFSWRSFRRLDAPPDTQLAIRIGLLLLTVSCLIGFAILGAGKYQARLGNDPSIWGKAGVTKFPHGIAIHALQFLPLLCWLMQTVGISKPARVRLVAFSGASMSVLLVFSLVQTLQGRSRLDFGLIGAILLILGAGLMLPLAAHLIGKCLTIFRRVSLPKVPSMLILLAPTMLACCCGSGLVAAQNWPQWGGPQTSIF